MTPALSGSSAIASCVTGPPVSEVAPAKLNLALHVTGRRADGYHLLDSLVVFAGVCDRLHLSPGSGVVLSGPFAGGLSAGDNLCVDAARLAGAQVAIRLEKNMPVASGIGGGSSDAAAVLRGLARMGVALPPRDAITRLGADVPVCMLAQPARMRGVGDVLDPRPDLPDLALVLVNPGISLTTPAVFAALTRADSPGLPDLAPHPDTEGLINWMKDTRNDLQAPALRLAPIIGEALAVLDGEGALLSRMSGSGATCFGVFDDPATAQMAAARIRAARLGWWVHATGLAHRAANR